MPVLFPVFFPTMQYISGRKEYLWVSTHLFRRITTIFEEFKQNCKDKSSAAYRNSEEWEFFREGNGDDRYKHFWDRHGGTTTEEISQQRASYRRRVLDPTNPEHQRFLKVQNDSPDFQRYLYMVEDFATSITLTSGEICTQRVCPVCHNPAAEPVREA